MTLTKEEIKTLFPHASQAFLEANEIKDRSQISNPKPERNQAPALGRPIPGKEEGTHKIAVSFTGYRVCPLDPDNFAGGVKDLLDGLRHAGIIPDDTPGDIILRTEQCRTKHRKEEKTVIEIEIP